MRAPNVILINCDDLGYGDLGCYGSTVNDTPNIDRLCQDGLKLNDFYMASPVCSPSRGAMMTGCYPPRISFGDFDGECVLFPGQGIGLHPQEKTMAHMFKEQDYRTMIIGKWHCGDQVEFLPCQYGFDDYYGLPYSNDMGRQPVEPMWPPLPLISGNTILQQQPDQSGITERYTEQAVRFLRKNRDNPFFLYFAHMHVHLPHYAARRFEQASRNGEYGASVMEIDWSVGVIMAELQRLGISDDTLVIFTSDNGSTGRYGGSNEPLRSIKRTTWDGGQRVPCIWHWPGKIAPGESSELIASMDFFATFAGIIGGQMGPLPTDSLDVSDVIFAGSSGKSPRETFFYYFMNGLEAVRHGPWKLHVRKEAEEVNQLYNLRDDIAESNDVYSENPAIVQQLNVLLNECREDIGDSWQNIPGRNVRPAGRVEHPVPLTEYDENHPYIVAMYDKPERG